MTNDDQILQSPRLLIIGNSGSGKSTLAAALARRHEGPAIDLDRLHWEDNDFSRKRDEAAACDLAAQAASAPSWIIEGVYGWLAAVALPRATALLWLDLSWSECRAGLLARGPWRGVSDEDFAAFLTWAEEYWTRKTPSSFAGHLKIYESFEGAKRRLKSREDARGFMAQ
jgi:adenylate kinase family enzyme